MLDRRKLQVFVSSTYTDLVEERQTAVAAILKAGHIPAGMELFTSGDKSQLEVIKRWIDQSDVYMLILGTRYGSIEPDSGLGYTEVEYNYAVSTGKPLFAIVMDDAAIDAKLMSSGSKYLEKSHPDKLAAFRTVVLSKMCSMFSETKDIKSHVYESLIDLANQPGLEGWVRGGLATNTQALYDKVSDLTATNEKLQSEVDNLRLAQSSRVVNKTDGDKYDQLMAALKAIKIEIPEEIASDGALVKTNAFRMFILNRNLYVSGITITNPSTPRQKWFEKNLYPIFITHRLFDIERKAAGGRFYSMADRGLDFAAWLDMRTVINEGGD